MLSVIYLYLTVTLSETWLYGCVFYVYDYNTKMHFFAWIYNECNAVDLLPKFSCQNKSQSAHKIECTVSGPWRHNMRCFMACIYNFEKRMNIIREWFVNCLVPSLYLNQYWYIVSQTPENIFQPNLNKNTTNFIQVHPFVKSSAKWRPFCLGLNVLIKLVCPFIEMEGMR